MRVTLEHSEICEAIAEHIAKRGMHIKDGADPANYRFDVDEYGAVTVDLTNVEMRVQAAPPPKQPSPKPGKETAVPQAPSADALTPVEEPDGDPEDVARAMASLVQQGSRIPAPVKGARATRPDPTQVPDKTYVPPRHRHKNVEATRNFEDLVPDPTDISEEVS